MALRRLSALVLPLLPLLVPLSVLSGASLLAEPTAAAQGAAKPPPKKPDAKPATTPAPATPAAATPPPPAPAAAETPPAKPADPDKEDPRAIYLSADIGFIRHDVGGLSNNTGFDKTSANGLLAGFGIGYRFKSLRIGARFRDAATTEFSLWSLMGEIGYGLDFKPIAPVLFVHAGYMFDTGIERPVFASALPRGNILTPNVDLDGLVIGGELGANYLLTKVLRIGPFIGLDFTFLKRAQADLPQSIVPIDDATKKNPIFSDSGSGVGYAISIGVRGTGDISF